LFSLWKDRAVRLWRIRGGDAFGGGEDQAGWKRRVGAVAGAGVFVVYQAGAERFWSLCARSAAKLERPAAVVMKVITGESHASTERKRAGRKSDPAPRNRLQTGFIPAKANLKGQKFWNEME
jgi:hypothetical protein